MTVRATGSLFDGRARRIADIMSSDVNDATAQEAFEQVGAALRAVLKNPTGFYQSRITINRARGSVVVDDSGVVYGPWLAGVSSRNQATRFKGYAHWRQATQRTQTQVRRIADPIVRRHVKAMNR